MSILLFLIIILAIIVFIGILNERIFKLQSDIALILFTVVISLCLLIAKALVPEGRVTEFISGLGDFGFEEYLMDGALCFMLFAGAGKVNMGKFRQNLRPICLLALLSTMISSFAYGAMFYLVALLFKLPLDIWACILLGCVVSPTDPIAATGILNKIGLSKNVCSVIENESLFNDGTGVTLFLFVRSIVVNSGKSNFFVLIGREVIGAVAVAFIVSICMFQLMKLTRNPVRYILISLLTVSLSYVICEHLGFSGVIASVVCGMFFSYKMDKMERHVMIVDPKDYYRDFWEILENILNAILFVMIGLLVLDVKLSSYILILVPASILILIVSRAIGVFTSSVMTGKHLPGNYSLGEFVVLMTWAALKGGLSLALAMGTKEYLSPEIYNVFINVTYISIFFTVLVQGLTVGKAYMALEKHKLGRQQKLK